MFSYHIWELVLRFKIVILRNLSGAKTGALLMIIFSNVLLTGKLKHSITNQSIWIKFLESINHNFNSQKKALSHHLWIKYQISHNKICKQFTTGLKIYNTLPILKIDLIVPEFANPACFISVKIFQLVRLSKHVFISLKMIFFRMRTAMQSQQYLKV